MAAALEPDINEHQGQLGVGGGGRGGAYSASSGSEGGGLVVSGL